MANEKRKDREGKSYQLKDSARRAAKEDGLKPDEFIIMESARNGGGFYYMKKTQKPAFSTDEIPDDVVEEVKKELEEEQKNHREPITDVVVHNDPINALPVEEEVSIPGPTKIPAAVGSSKVQGQLIAVMTSAQDLDLIRAAEQVRTVVENATLPTPVITTAKPKTERLHKSEIPNPTKTVWHVADAMFAANPNVTRKQVMDECVKKYRIAFWTARTQYQQWLTAKRESDANAAAVNNKKK
jgi:hypothetical protein